ncbi:ABC transporter substrate-binding protein [Rhodococcus wratislaviensis]|uniref:Putative ABC transporter substrate-binding protein n=1 Tax=Rhodococcus wratislaviensis NBRC 100605 TaxID=1219028 RepID=X0PNP6_RHOWR|nr:ABC transporter substrate-binding protein [Rhodococcus wratislaviensis]GAF44289.1 putative ABC transporter substrate-binding protein [Rhodococcus wratislaviensis NBRC 100605]
MLRRRWALLAIPAALAVALTACGSQSGPLKADEAGVTTVRVTSSQSFNTAPATLLTRGDFAERYGLNFEQVNIAGSGSSNQIAAILSGDADIAIAGSNAFVDSVIGGANLQIIAGVSDIIQSLVVSNSAIERFGVDVNASPDERVRALRGMKIGAGVTGSAGNSALRVVLSHAGLDPDRDVTLVPLADTTTAVGAGLEQGTYDATWAAAGSGEVAVARGTATTLISVPNGEAPALDGYVCNVVFAPTRFIEQNPEVVDRIRDALAEATRMTKEEPQKAGQILKNSIYSGMDQQVFDISWSEAVKAYYEGNLFTREDWNTFVKIFDPLSEHDYSSIDYEEIINPVARGES